MEKELVIIIVRVGGKEKNEGAKAFGVWVVNEGEGQNVQQIVV